MARGFWIYGFAFSAVVALDAAKYLTFGFPALINWESFAHPAWVIGALALFFASLKFDNRAFWKFLFGVYIAVTLAALANHYLPFSETLTYNCMLFNLVFASLYFAILQCHA
ncbi:MAG: hypothetical protein HYS44_04015 [Candidatus Niyogibacteria bacterium]|nr:hypothetical protein [Candidatus Niyogibacteria bacterium]